MGFNQTEHFPRTLVKEIAHLAQDLKTLILRSQVKLSSPAGSRCLVLSPSRVRPPPPTDPCLPRLSLCVCFRTNFLTLDVYYNQLIVEDVVQQEAFAFLSLLGEVRVREV